MLPDFPLFLSVSGMVEISATPLARLSLPWCNASQLLESSPDSAVETGRWVVQDKVTEHAFQRVWGGNFAGGLIPSLLTVFQTTTAAWPKWGNYGVSWPANSTQPMPFVADFVMHFNELAWGVMRDRNIPVMDAYWLTSSRPDHRESTISNNLAAALAHAGPDVYAVLVRKCDPMSLV